MFSIYDGRDVFYQWDLNRKLIVYDESILEVHFCNKTDDCSLVCSVYDEGGLRVVNVPNILLTTDLKIRVYGYSEGFTKHEACFAVHKRTKPADYIYTETEVIDWRETVGEIETCLDKIIDIEFEILGIPNYKNPITFYLDGTPYVADEGMTWEELCNSPFCPTIWQDCCSVENKLFYTGWYGEDDYQVYVDNCCGPPYYLEFEGNYVSKQDTIVPEGHYTAIQ